MEEVKFGDIDLTKEQHKRFDETFVDMKILTPEGKVKGAWNNFFKRYLTRELRLDRQRRKK